MRKIVSHLLFVLGIFVPTITFATSSCNLSNNQNLISTEKSSSSGKPTIKELKSVTMNEKRARVIHCKGLGENHFADIFFYYANGKQTLKINTYQNKPHDYFGYDDPYVTLRVLTQNDEKKFELKIIGDKVLTTGEEIVALEEGYKIDFFHREGTSRAKLWDAQYINNKFEDKDLIGGSTNFSFFVSNDIELWQDHNFATANRYDIVFSNFGFIFLQKNFSLVLFDKIKKEKFATLFTSSFNGGCMYLLSNKTPSNKERKLFYQDKSGNKCHFSFKQDKCYVIENLAKEGTDFNFSNIDNFELQSNQMNKIKYLLGISNGSWFYLTADDIWNTKNRYEYVLTEQDHVLMQYSFKNIVENNLYLRKNLLSFKYKRFYQWILSSKEALFYYLSGGHAQPKEHSDKYEFWIDIDNNSDAEWRAFEIWYDIWRNHPESLTGKYLKISIAIALELANGIECHGCSDEIPSPLKRYELMVWLDSQGVYKARPLENNSVQELRNIIGFKTGNEDAKWLYLYVCKDLEKELTYDFIKSGCSLIQYVEYSIYSIIDEAKFYGPHEWKFYRFIKYSGVCGAAGTIGAIVANLFGLQSMAIGQPGHCAYLYHNDATYGYEIGYDIYGWERTFGYRTWIQWMFADDHMHHSSRYFYDEFYAINNYIDGFLAKNKQETNKQKVINDFHALIEKSNKQLCISEKSQWGWVKRGQILKHFARYDYLQSEIRSLRAKAVGRISDIFQDFELNECKLLEYYII